MPAKRRASPTFVASAEEPAEPLGATAGQDNPSRQSMSEMDTYQRLLPTMQAPVAEATEAALGSVLAPSCQLGIEVGPR